MGDRFYREKPEEPFICQKCGKPQTKNPHPDAGKPDHMLEVGYVWACIPCLNQSRHHWASKAMEMHGEIEDIKAETNRLWYVLNRIAKGKFESGDHAQEIAAEAIGEDRK